MAHTVQLCYFMSYTAHFFALILPRKVQYVSRLCWSLTPPSTFTSLFIKVTWKPQWQLSLEIPAGCIYAKRKHSGNTGQYLIIHCLKPVCLQFPCSQHYLLMPSEKHNSRARDLISLPINVASSRDVPFHQPQLLQCLHQGATFVPLWSPILFSTIT